MPYLAGRVRHPHLIHVPVSELWGSVSFHLSASLLSFCLSDSHQFGCIAQESYHSAPSLSLRHVDFPDATIPNGEREWSRLFPGSPEGPASPWLPLPLSKRDLVFSL